MFNFVFRFSKWNSQLDDLDVDIDMIKEKLRELDDAADEAELCLEENGPRKTFFVQSIVVF